MIGGREGDACWSLTGYGNWYVINSFNVCKENFALSILPQSHAVYRKQTILILNVVMLYEYTSYPRSLIIAHAHAFFFLLSAGTYSRQ